MLIRPGRVGRIGSTGRLGAGTPAPTPTPTSAWNPADNNPANVLSNNNKTSTRTQFDGSANSRNSLSHAPGSGKWYAEFLLVGGNVAGTQIGIANAAKSQSDYIGNNNSAGYGNDGFTGVLDNFVNRSAPFSASGTVLAVSIDQTVAPNIVHFYKDGTCITGDPIAGTGGHTIAADTYFLILSTFQHTSSFTLRTGTPEFSYSPPTGYSAWG
jgi:hypothetical protein